MTVAITKGTSLTIIDAIGGTAQQTIEGRADPEFAEVALRAQLGAARAEVERLKADVTSLDVLARGERAMVDTANDVIADLRAKISECAALGLELGRRLTERDAEVDRLTAREREAARILSFASTSHASAWSAEANRWLAGCKS